MKKIKGPAIFLAQFIGDKEPFNSLPSICKWVSDLGYKESDVVDLVKVTLPQHRVIKLSPIEVDAKDLKNLFIKSLDDSWID